MACRDYDLTLRVLWEEKFSQSQGCWLKGGVQEVGGVFGDWYFCSKSSQVAVLIQNKTE